MKKLMIFAIALSCATVFVGCGDKAKMGTEENSASKTVESPQSKHEKIVKDLCALLQTEKKREVMDKFWEENVDSHFQDMIKRGSEKENSKAFKKAFGKMAKSKEPVTTKVVKTFEENGTVMGSAIEAQCADTTLYFIVGKAGKDKADKILGITSNKEEALAGGR